jgi:hypothetical protein
MPSLVDLVALAVSIGFISGAFRQLPIDDYMVEEMAKSELWASVFGARYIMSFIV